MFLRGQTYYIVFLFLKDLLNLNVHSILLNILQFRPVENTQVIVAENLFIKVNVFLDAF